MSLHVPSSGEAEEPSLVGQVLGNRYRIVEQLGEGGMGIVYLAEQALGAAKRKVAVKTLRSEFSRNPTLNARFHREVVVIAQLEHPNTVRVYDFGETEQGALYIVMEFLAGLPLSAAIQRERALTPTRVAHFLQQIAGSLDEAHARGIIHRDLKPDNVILTQPGGARDVVKLVDFGIAHTETESRHPNAKLTKEGTIIGTPPYMSPEQFNDRPVDARSDIYSLGVMTYEMLTGQLPFQAQSLWQWAQAHLTADPIPFEASPAGRDVPPAARSAVLRALSKEPSQRHASAGELHAAFVAGLSEPKRAPVAAKPIRSGPPPLPPHLAARPIASDDALAATERAQEVPRTQVSVAPSPNTEPVRPMLSAPLAQPGTVRATTPSASVAASRDWPSPKRRTQRIYAALAGAAIILAFLMTVALQPQTKRKAPSSVVSAPASAPQPEVPSANAAPVPAERHRDPRSSNVPAEKVPAINVVDVKVPPASTAEPVLLPAKPERSTRELEGATKPAASAPPTEHVVDKAPSNAQPKSETQPTTSPNAPDARASAQPPASTPIRDKPRPSSRAETNAAVRKALAQTMNDYARTRDVSAADGELLEAIGACGSDCSPNVVAQAWMYIGLVKGNGAKDWDTAREAFTVALGFDNDIELDPRFSSPTAQTLFEAIKNNSER